MQRFRGQLLALASLASGLLAPASARAASLQKVNQTDWWAGVSGLPSYVNMYIYVPDRPATKPPIVVAPHHCQGTGTGTYGEMSSLVSIANNTGFIMIFPEATGQNCWDAGSTRSLKHNGGGDTGAVAQMVKYTVSKYGADANRVYVVGGSSGGIMTEALLGVYPDVFMGGVSLMGVPCGCWAQGYNDVTGNGSTAQWSGPCAGGSVTKTAPQWGDLVRSYYPGYTAHRPRLQHWHGTSDTTLNYKNVAEDIKELTNLLGLSEMPTGTDTPKSGTTHQFWKNGCGFTVYETFSLSGVGHNVPFDGNAVAAYFGLATAASQDPETAACPGAVPGGTGAGGGSGTTGSGGAGGAAGTGGNGGGRGGGGGAGGGGVAGGGGGVDAGRDAGGSSGASGAAGAGGGGSSGGAGAAAGSGGITGAGGMSGFSGNGATGAGGETAGRGGNVAGGGSSGQGGRGGAGVAGADGQGGGAATGGATPAETSGSGCGCLVASGTTGAGPTATAFIFIGALLLLRGRAPPARRRARRRSMN
jgi:poly(hydroxyalkanoate) depolymerase family esterase